MDNVNGYDSQQMPNPERDRGQPYHPRTLFINKSGQNLNTYVLLDTFTKQWFFICQNNGKADPSRKQERSYSERSLLLVTEADDKVRPIHSRYQVTLAHEMIMTHKN